MGLQRRDDRGELMRPSGAPPRLKVRRGPDGRLVVADGDPGAAGKPVVEAAERPPQPDDPPSGSSR